MKTRKVWKRGGGWKRNRNETREEERMRVRQKERTKYIYMERKRRKSCADKEKILTGDKNKKTMTEGNVCGETECEALSQDEAIEREGNRNDKSMDKRGKTTKRENGRRTNSA